MRAGTKSAVALTLLIAACAPADSPTLPTPTGSNTESTIATSTVPDEAVAERSNPGAIGDLDDPITILDDGSTFDPEWEAGASLSCSTIEGERTLDTLWADTNDRGTPAFYASESSGRMSVVTLGDSVRLDQTLFWAVEGILLGPWPIERVVDTCQPSISDEAAVDISNCETHGEPLAPLDGQPAQSDRHMIVAVSGESELAVCDVQTGQLGEGRYSHNGAVVVVAAMSAPEASTSVLFLEADDGRSRTAWVDAFSPDGVSSAGPFELYPAASRSILCADGEVKLVDFTLPASAVDPQMIWAEQNLWGSTLDEGSIHLGEEYGRAAEVVNGRCGLVSLGSPFRAAATLLSVIVESLAADVGVTTEGYMDHPIDPIAETSFEFEGAEYFIVLNLDPGEQPEGVLSLDCAPGRIAVPLETPSVVVEAINNSAGCT